MRVDADRLEIVHVHEERLLERDGTRDFRRQVGIGGARPVGGLATATEKEHVGLERQHRHQHQANQQPRADQRRHAPLSWSGIRLVRRGEARAKRESDVWLADV